jgi:hypothetical protein
LALEAWTRLYFDDVNLFGRKKHHKGSIEAVCKVRKELSLEVNVEKQNMLMFRHQS